MSRRNSYTSDQSVLAFPQSTSGRYGEEYSEHRISSFLVSTLGSLHHGSIYVHQMLASGTPHRVSEAFNGGNWKVNSAMATSIKAGYGFDEPRRSAQGKSMSP